MKITRTRLRKIIKEEKLKLISEARPDGTISDDEDEAEEELLMRIEMQIDEMIDMIKQEAYVIGGQFRGPGIKARAMKLLANKIHGAR